MPTRNITPDERGPSANAPVRPTANHWPPATPSARTQRELVQLSLRLCPGVGEAR